MPKPEKEFAPVQSVEWTPVDPRVPALSERILARDAEANVATRILRFGPGTDTSPMGVQTHPFWEEVYILSGTMTDISVGQTFSEGDYACRPPGMKHGPWRTEEGCVTFEVRYVADRGE